MPNVAVDREIDFFENYSVIVTFEFDGEIYNGLLSINPSSFPILKIYNGNSTFIFEDDRPIDLPIVCQEIGGNRFFTLHKPRLQRGTIFSESVLTGKEVACSFNKIELLLTGISTWLEWMWSNDITETEFKVNIDIEKFSVDFSYKENEYTINNSRDTSCKRVRSTERLVKIKDSFIIEKNNGDFLLSEVKDLTQEIRNLFSLLLGCSLSIRNIFLIPSKYPFVYQSYYFPCINYKKYPLDNCHQSFCSYWNVLEWNLWDSIFNNFFEKNSFRTIWHRLVPTFNNSASGYWEHQILSIVVILEMYCTKETKEKGGKLSKVKYNDLRSSLIRTLDDFAERSCLSDNDNLVLEGFYSVVNGVKNKSHPTLQHKYNLVMEGVDSEIRDVIDFDESYFTIIKNIRNKTSHGINYETLVPGDVTKEFKIRDRLLVLLTYFFFRDLGFADVKIAQCLSRTHNSFVLNAGGNERARDKLTEQAMFIKLHEESNLNGLDSYQVIVVRYNLSSKQYTVDRNLTDEVKSGWHSSGTSNVVCFVENKIFKDKGKDYKVKYINKIYISTYGKEEIRFYGAVLVTEA